MYIFQRLKRRALNLFAKDGTLLGRSWQSTRDNYLKETGKVCRCCGSTKNVEVHHKIPRHIRPDLVHDKNNLIALCRDCHFHIGHLNDFSNYNAEVEKVCNYVRQRGNRNRAGKGE